MINSFNMTAITLSIILFSCGPTEKRIIIDTWENGNVAVEATYLTDESSEQMIKKDIYTSGGFHFMSIDFINNDTLRYYELPEPFEGAEFQGKWKASNGTEEDESLELIIDRNTFKITVSDSTDAYEMVYTRRMIKNKGTIYTVDTDRRFYHPSQGDIYSNTIDNEKLTDEGLLLYRNNKSGEYGDTLKSDNIIKLIFINNDTLNLVESDSLIYKWIK